MSGANSTNGSGKKELAFIVGGFFPGREGRERMVAPYAIDKELIGDPVFSEFARAACPFMMPGIYPQDPDLAVSTGYRMKETGHQAFKEGDYKLAATKYNYSVQLFQFVLKIFPYVAHEVLLLHNSLSACYYKMKDYEKALASANTCIELDNKEIKGFYRRAEASLGLADVGSSEGKDVTKLYEEALGDFCKCYYTMTMESDKGARVQQFCDAMIIAINLNLTENLPDFHEFDKDSFCGPLILYLLNNYSKEKIEKALQFLFFPSPSIEKSGLAFKYPCDVSSLSVCLVYTRGVLTEPILDMLVQCNLQVKQTDVVQLVSALQESELSLFQRLVSICEAQSTTSCESAFSHLLDRSLLSKNRTFATYLISKGVTPTRLSSALAFEMLMEFNSSQNEDIIKIANACSPDVRAEFAAKSLAMSNLQLFHEILDTGPLHSCYIDISTFICSPLMNEEMKYLNRFLDTGACPNGMVGSTSPMVAIFQGNTLNRETPVPLSRETQVLLVVILIERGASVINLTGAFPDPMSPVHVATKLVLETKIMKLLHLVCERFDFPSNGRIVDKHNRTPLHIVMITEPTLLSLEILEVLVKYNIDKSIKDDQGKRAEDYTRPQLDEKRRALVSVRPPAKVKELKDKEGGGAVTGDKGGLPWRYKEYNFDDEDISSDEETGSGRRGGRKKWEMRYLKMAKSGRPPWSCDMSLFPPSTSYEKALAIAREQKERGNSLFGDKKYSEALQMYGKSHMTYDWICVNHPRKLSAVKDDIKVLVCNMALGYHRSSVPEASVECCNDAIDIDPTYYKAYYRRAEAYKYIAKERTHQTRRDYNFECYCLAVKDYARAYKYSTATNETSKRADMFYECMVIALDVDHTKFLPSIHDCDKSQLLTKVVELLVKNREKQSKELSLYLDYLLLKTSHIPNAGLAQSYPCSCSSVPLVHVLPNVQIDLYRALLMKGCTVTQDDIVALIRVLKKSQGQLLKLLLDSFMKDRDDIQSSLTSICVQILSTKKIPFISTLVKNGATPPSESILEHSDFFKLDSVLSKYVSNACKPESRTKLFCSVLQSGGTKESIDVLLQSGPVLIQEIDLSAIITSSLLLHHTEILKELYSITPPSDLPVTSSASKALSVLLGSKLPSQLQQAQLADSLIRLGANISGLPQAYSEPLSPVHAATKLALETGHVDLVHTVCTRYAFDGQVKLIDRNTQTPLHYVMRSKHNEKSIKICQYLCDYPIDPQIKDRWGKAAQEYGKKEGDKRLTYLHRAAVLTGRHTPTPEAPETGAAESAPNMNENVVNEAISSSNPPPPQSEGGKGRKNKKKKKNKGGNAASSSDKTTHDNKSVPLVNGTVDNGTVDNGRDSPVTPEEKVHVHVPVSATEASETQPSCPSLKTLLSVLNEKGSEYFTLQIDLTDPSEDAAVDQHESSFSGTDAIVVESDYITQEDKLSLSNGVAADEVFKIDFDNLPWEVEVTDRVLLFLKDPAYSKVLKISVISRLQELARGCLSDGKTLSCSAQLYKTSLTGLSCIMWEKAIQFSSRCTDKTEREDSSHVYSEVIRVWDVIPNKEHLTCLQQIERSHQRGLQSHLCFPLLPSEEDGGRSPHSHLPRHFLIFKDHNPAHDDSVAMVTYIPPARVKEDEYNVVTFYSLTSSVVQSVINGYRPRRDFPFKEWPKEHDIIHLPSNGEAILLLGRSGTGKTTCCLYRLWNQFNKYWEQVFANEGDPCYPHRPLPLMGQSSIELRDIVGAEDEGMGGDGEGVVYINEEEDEGGEGEDEVVKFEHLHQVFLTKNYVLCSQMKKRFYDMVASYDTYSQHLEYEALPCPLSLKDINSKAFPLFLTSRQFLLLLDNSLGGKTFFPRNRDGSLAVKICSSDYETEDLGTLLDLDVSDGEEEETNEEDELARVVGIKQVPVWREVTSCYFVNEIWPKICSHCSDKSIDPLLVWIEIKSFIKGSLLAVSKPSGCLSPWEYESIGRKMATNFSGNRTEIYSLFEHYRDYVHRKRSLNLFDENDLINNIYQRLVKLESPELPWSIHHFFIDEVQDFTQSELALILRLSQEPNGLFLTGDTAQSIMKGISFRFRDLRSLFHLAKTQSAALPSPMRISVPRVHELLINFRSHSGILRLATSVIELLKEYFPSSFDRLPEDRGMFPGPLPVFIQSCHVTDLAVLLRSNKRASSCIEFGAHQVIIVQNEEAKKSLPDVLKGAVVLTVFESKGLEFDDVLLYNFFTDSSITKEWRVVSTYADKTAPPSDSKTKPRPLNFNERFHKSLNSEFKYLYTAITRAKCNLWIYD
ncbi:PREDICTED: uncharacterized protein LOC100635005, partial [Amphimedon queenslandica]|uniref:UvrD-like helicase ATP-binding domain-containing protein n=1 Tax=Amphimedon queenslandica TaxID=400682 RepID=A0AAN0JSA3_AMPQE